MIKSVYLLIEESQNNDTGTKSETLVDVYLNEALARSWIDHMRKTEPRKRFSLRQRTVCLTPPEKEKSPGVGLSF